MSRRRNGLGKQVTEEIKSYKIPWNLGERESQGKRSWVKAVGRGTGALHRESLIGFFGLKAFIWPPKDFRGESSERSKWNAHQCSRCNLSGPWSPLIGWYSVWGVVISQCSWSWCRPWSLCLVLLPFRAWSPNTTEAWMHLMQVRTSLSWGLHAWGLCCGPLVRSVSGYLTCRTSDMLGKERAPWGRGPCFPSFVCR